MKTAIHPKYFEAAVIKCSCGNVIVAGSTKENLKTELCSHCHPFYTGQQKLVDTAGRVDKFQAKRKQAANIKEEAQLKKEAKKKKPAGYVEKVVPEEVLKRAMSEMKPEGKWDKPLGDSPAEEVMKDAAEQRAPKANKPAAKKKAPSKKSTSKKK